MNTLAAIARQFAADLGEHDAPKVYSARSSSYVARFGAMVVKVRSGHPPPSGLPAVFAAPISVRVVDGVVVSAWEAGDPVDPEAPPWSAAGELLARLHLADTPIAAAATTPQRVDSAVAALSASAVASSEAAAVVLRAARSLTSPPESSRVLIHGDFHLGQLARFGGRWLLIDVDDAGLGDPRWDFARPAAWFALGIIDADDWRAFVESYRAAGGPAITHWHEIDYFARAMTVHAAAQALVKSSADQRIPTEEEQAFIAACKGIAHLYPS